MRERYDAEVHISDNVNKTDSYSDISYHITATNHSAKEFERVSTEAKYDYLVGIGLGQVKIDRLDENKFKCWIINDNNISRLFHQYRNRVYKQCEGPTLLTKSNRLVLNCLLEIDQNQTKPHFLTTVQFEGCLIDLKKKDYKMEKLSQRLSIYLVSVATAAVDDHSTCESIAENFQSMNEEERIVKRMALNVISRYSNTLNADSLDEDGFLRDCVEPLMNTFFKIDGNLIVKDSSSTCQSNALARKDFDPVLEGRLANYSIVYESQQKYDIPILECKAPKDVGKTAHIDELKLPSLVKNCIDNLHSHQLHDDDIVVIGLIVDGYDVKCYIIDLKYSMMYRFYKFTSFYIPRITCNFFNLIPAAQSLLNTRRLPMRNCQAIDDEVTSKLTEIH